MLISSSADVEGRRILYKIGNIEAASAWHAANGAPQQESWREFILQELIRKAEDIDADAIIALIAKPTASLCSVKLGCHSSAISRQVWQSNFPARPSCPRPRVRTRVRVQLLAPRA
jgi:hypothetical protein